jgi:hypothetical protein
MPGEKEKLPATWVVSSNLAAGFVGSHRELHSLASAALFFNYTLDQVRRPASWRIHCV